MAQGMGGSGGGKDPKSMVSSGVQKLKQTISSSPIGQLLNGIGESAKGS